MDPTVHRLVDSLARDSASRLVAALARRLGAGRIALAEDAVQHTLMQALSLWPFKGVPQRPEAWLSTVGLRGGSLPALRACITNHRTRADDLDALVETLAAARAHAAT